jgi:hypothetical protein
MKQQHFVGLLMCIGFLLVVLVTWLMFEFVNDADVVDDNVPAVVVLNDEEGVGTSFDGDGTLMNEEGILKGETPLFFTTMSHMESNFKDDVLEQMFLNHVDILRETLLMFDEYGAKLTIESEKPFARANHVWGINFLEEVVNLGHGVGTHCDFGVNEPEMSVEQYARFYRENKRLVDDLVGAENNKGCSGGWGPNDWVLGAATGGFEYLDAFAGFAYLSMPLSERPDGWTDAHIIEVTYHDPVPVDLYDRLYLYDLADALDFDADEDGVITVSGGDLGEISSLAEGRDACGTQCDLTREDIDYIFETVEDVLENRDASRVAKLNLHIPLTVFVDGNEEMLRYFLAGMEKYVEAGDVVWATQLEVFEFYKQWTR